MFRIIKSCIPLVMNNISCKILLFFNSKNLFSLQIILAFDLKIMYF